MNYIEDRVTQLELKLEALDSRLQVHQRQETAGQCRKATGTHPDTEAGGDKLLVAIKALAYTIDVCDNAPLITVLDGAVEFIADNRKARAELPDAKDAELLAKIRAAYIRVRDSENRLQYAVQPLLDILHKDMAERRMAAEKKARKKCATKSKS